MINDQATALRKMKQEMEMPKITPEEFLGTVPHPCKPMSISLVFPDEYEQHFNHVEKWLPSVMNKNVKTCFWDQANMAPNLVLNSKAGSLRYRMLETVETDSSRLTIRPAQTDYIQIIHDSPMERITFLKHIVHDLKDFKEVWISIRASQLKEHISIIKSSDAICVMVPPDSQSVLKCYEIVKNLKTSGCIAPISLLEFINSNSNNKQILCDRIKNVAKNFLGLDLIGSGMVLSNIAYEPPKNYTCLGEKIAALSAQDCDFLYVLSESILYQIPGMI